MTQEQFHFEFNGTTIPTDKAGYLLDHTLWNEDMVPTLAANENITLSEPHWEVIRFVRNFYEEFEICDSLFNSVPSKSKKIRSMCCSSLT